MKTIHAGSCFVIVLKGQTCSPSTFELEDMNHKVLSVVLIFLCCWALYLVWVSGTTKTRQWTWAPPTPPTPTPPPPPPPPSRFLYLLQTESCLPDGLRSIEALGNATVCHCDVLVLSYKQTCNDTPPAHVEYISASVYQLVGMREGTYFSE